MKKSRIKLAAVNAITTGMVMLLNLPIQFLNRYFIVHYLGVKYLGITSLFTNILSILSLADLGIGSAIAFLLYKPLSDNDTAKVSVLMRYYRNIYCTISAVVFLLGICIIPFLGIFLKKDVNYSNVYLIFFIYLAGSASSYLFSYNQSLLYADQKSHIVAIFNLVVTYIMLTIQIITVIKYANPLLYAILFVFTGFVTNVVVSGYVKKKYRLLRNKAKLTKSEKDLLVQNVIGNFFLRVSGVIVTSTDSMLLSAFTGVIMVGYYANYVTVINVIQKFMTQVIGAVTGTIGNFSVNESVKSAEELFHRLQYLNFLLVSLASLAIIFLSRDVITLWLGAKYVLSTSIVMLMGFEFYVMNYRMIGWNFTAVYGLSKFMKLYSVSEMVVNLVTTFIFLAKFNMGLRGILLGTIISTLCTVTWQDPYVIFHHGFHTSTAKFFSRYAKNIVILFIEIIILHLINTKILSLITYGWLHLIAMGVVIVILGVIVPIIGYYSSDEETYFFHIVKKVLAIK